MGVRFPSVFTSTPIAAPPASGAETVYASTPALTLPIDSASVILVCSAALTVGTGTTSYNWALRRGLTVNDVLVTAMSNIVATAGNITLITCMFVDVSPPAGMFFYSFSIRGNGTTAAWTSGSVGLLAFAL